jgi:hypothetical protein
LAYNRLVTTKLQTLASAKAQPLLPLYQEIYDASDVVSRAGHRQETPARLQAAVDTMLEWKADAGAEPWTSLKDKMQNSISFRQEVSEKTARIMQEVEPRPAGGAPGVGGEGAAGGGGGRGRGISTPVSPYTGLCYKCGKPGHKRWQCTQENPASGGGRGRGRGRGQSTPQGSTPQTPHQPQTL